LGLDLTGHGKAGGVKWERIIQLEGCLPDSLSLL
jgi:hypothetical protein